MYKRLLSLFSLARSQKEVSKIEIQENSIIRRLFKNTRLYISLSLKTHGKQSSKIFVSEEPEYLIACNLYFVHGPYSWFPMLYLVYV